LFALPSPNIVESGGVMSYGVNQEELSKSVASTVDKLLKGTKPADLRWSSRPSSN
jgi:ABC-type uncharacterized transport system substrate-binding protein